MPMPRLHAAALCFLAAGMHCVRHMLRRSGSLTIHGNGFTSRFNSMTCNIFTYGSLMFPAVWEQVVRGQYRRVEAVLADHARYAIRNASYPGLMKQAAAAVEGVLYLDIDAMDVARLDTFEGADYRRTAVCVQGPGGAQLHAYTYLYNLPQRLLGTEWKAPEFDIHTFVQTYCPSR